MTGLIAGAGTNPETTPEFYELWARNHFDAIARQHGKPLPFYSHFAGKAHSYEYVGTYKIVDTTLLLANSQELAAIIQERRENVSSLLAARWTQKLSLDWDAGDDTKMP